jgi:hypothetical protein
MQLVKSCSPGRAEMSPECEAVHDLSTDVTSHGEPYDQFLLFGDSITELSGSQEKGFAFAPALQDGIHPTLVPDIIP